MGGLHPKISRTRAEDDATGVVNVKRVGLRVAAIVLNGKWHKTNYVEC